MRQECTKSSYSPKKQFCLDVTKKHHIENCFLVVLYKNNTKVSKKLYRELLNCLICVILKNSIVIIILDLCQRPF